jgi:hypothetical protein
MTRLALVSALARLTLALAFIGTLLGGVVAPRAASSQDRHTVYLPALRNPGVEQPPTPTPIPPEQSPLTIAVAPDAERAASARLGSEGGQLSATGADGVVYTLTIPPGALAYTQTLSLTPSGSVAGLPLSGGAIGAVQLAPEGLLLMQQATLTIALPESGGDETVYAFGFDGAGAEFHLRGSDAATPQEAELAGVKIITIRAPRLRGYGAGKGTEADVARYRSKHRPSRVADQIIEDELFVPIVTRDQWVQERRGELSAILELLGRAANNPAAVEDAVQAYIEWDMLLVYAPNWSPALEAERAEFKARLREAVKAASAGAAERCRNDHSLADGLRLQRWLYYLYTYALPMDPSYLEALVMECLSFDLDVKANFVRTGGVAGVQVRIDARVEGRIPLTPRLNYPQFSLAGQSDLTVNHISVTGIGECWTDFAQRSTYPMRVIDVSILPDGGDALVDSVLFDPGQGIWGTVTAGCGDGEPVTGDLTHVYASEFWMMHYDEMHGGTDSGIFRLPYWRRGLGDQVATTGSAYVRSKSFPGEWGNRIVEETTFTLVHRP